tara:strand:+ start:2667 stop:5648 length:2982 start_codon:yes stop_codon:yes gene_type:complete
MIDVYVDVDDSFTAAVAWLDSETYVKGDRVYDDSGQSIVTLSPIYVCVNANAGSAPSSSNANWILAGTSPEYPLLTKDPMQEIYSGRENPFDYEWSFDGTNALLDETAHPTVMRHYRMIEEAGGGSVIFMFETYDSPWTGTANNRAMLKLVPGSILSETTKLTFDSYNKNTTIIVNGSNGSGNSVGLNLGLLASDLASSPLANNYYFNNLTFNQTNYFSGLFAMAAGEFTGCKFIKTEWSGGSAGGSGHRFFVSNYGSTVKAKFKSCLFEQSYGAGVRGNSTGTEFISCTFVYTDYDLVLSYAYPTNGLNYLMWENIKTFKDNIFYIKKIQDFNPNQTYSTNHKVMDNGTIYYSQGTYTPGTSKPPSDPTSAWGTFNTDWTPKATDRSNNIIYIEGYESSSNYVGATYQNPMLVDPGSSDYRLRPSSPLIAGIETSNSNPEGVYIQSGDSTGGSGTFEDPYYMAELDTAETAAAADNGIIYFVDGYYEIDPLGLNFYADGITYKSLNKHKAILGSNDSNLLNAKKINIGGQYGGTNLGVGNITLEDFYIKNARFQQATNSASRPNKIKGLKIEDTHPIGHGTDGFLWSYGKLIIESCFIYLDFGQEPSYYLTRGSDSCEMLNTTLIINFSQTSGSPAFVIFGSIENSIIYATTEIPESGFPALTANSKNCCFYNIGSNITYGGENTYQGDPKFVDPNSRDFRLRADSPLIGGISKSKYPADAIWVNSEGAGTGTGTESDPFHFNGGASSQFLDAVNAAVSNGTFQVIFKDGDYRMTTAGEQMRVPNLGLVTLVAENKDQAVLSSQREVNIADLTSQTLKLKGFKLSVTGTEHFIHTQYISRPFHLHLDNCYLLAENFFALASGGSITANNSIMEKMLGSNKYLYSGLDCTYSFKNCLFIDRNLSNDQGFNHNVRAEESVFKNCIFRSEQSGNSLPPVIGELIACAVYNYDASSYSDKEVILDGDPLMIDFDPTSHENSNYALRPLSPLIGQGK